MYLGYQWLALGAAFSWGCSNLVSVTPARHLGTFAYSRWRMASVAVMVSLLACVLGNWSSISINVGVSMAASGLIGIFIGDTCLFACLNRLGPRRSNLLFSCHALFSALFGIWFFDEIFQGTKLIGALFVVAGVMTAIFFRQSAAKHQWEETRGNLWIGIALGLAAAICQSLGGVIAKPVLTEHVDPLAATAIRMITAFLAHGALHLFQFPLTRSETPINWRIFGMVTLNGLLAMVMGMTMFTYALKLGEVGIVSLLSSTTPVILIPLIWIFTKVRPASNAWFGAIIAVIGTGLILAHS